MLSEQYICIQQWQIWLIIMEIRNSLDSCKSLWDNITNKQIYINGSIGSTPSGEAFTKDYDLPNDTNYSETCAALGMIFLRLKCCRILSRVVMQIQLNIFL